MLVCCHQLCCWFEMEITQVEWFALEQFCVSNFNMQLWDRKVEALSNKVLHTSAEFKRLNWGTWAGVSFAEDVNSSTHQLCTAYILESSCTEGVNHYCVYKTGCWTLARLSVVTVRNICCSVSENVFSVTFISHLLLVAFHFACLHIWKISEGWGTQGVLLWFDPGFNILWMCIRLLSTGCSFVVTGLVYCIPKVTVSINISSWVIGLALPPSGQCITKLDLCCPGAWPLGFTNDQCSVATFTSGRIVKRLRTDTVKLCVMYFLLRWSWSTLVL